MWLIFWSLCMRCSKGTAYIQRFFPYFSDFIVELFPSRTAEMISITIFQMPIRNYEKINASYKSSLLCQHFLFGITVLLVNYLLILGFPFSFPTDFNRKRKSLNFRINMEVFLKNKTKIYWKNTNDKTTIQTVAKETSWRLPCRYYLNSLLFKCNWNYKECCRFIIYANMVAYLKEIFMIGKITLLLAQIIWIPLN